MTEPRSAHSERDCPVDGCMVCMPPLAVAVAPAKLEFFSEAVAERDRLRAGISHVRGMCSDGEPLEAIDAKLGEILNG